MIFGENQTNEIVHVDARLADGGDIFELSQKCGENLAEIKKAYDSLLSRTRKENFLKFFTDEQIIESGIFSDLGELVENFPNLRYT